MTTRESGRRILVACPLCCVITNGVSLLVEACSGGLGWLALTSSLVDGVPYQSLLSDSITPLVNNACLEAQG